MSFLKEMFGTEKPIIGLLHLCLLYTSDAADE